MLCGGAAGRGGWRQAPGGVLLGEGERSRCAGGPRRGGNRERGDSSQRGGNTQRGDNCECGGSSRRGSSPPCGGTRERGVPPRAPAAAVTGIHGAERVCALGATAADGEREG